MHIPRGEGGGGGGEGEGGGGEGEGGGGEGEGGGGEGEGGGGFGDWFQGGNVTLFISLAAAGSFLLIVVCLFLGATPERAEAFGKVFGSVANVVRAARGVQEKETEEDKERAAQNTALRTIELANALGALRATPASSGVAPGGTVASERSLTKASKAESAPDGSIPTRVMQGATMAAKSTNSMVRRGIDVLMAPPPPLTNNNATTTAVTPPPPSPPSASRGTAMTRSLYS